MLTELFILSLDQKLPQSWSLYEMKVPITYSCLLILITHIKGEQEPHSLGKLNQTQTAETLSVHHLVLQKAQLAPFNLAVGSSVVERREDQEQ